MSHSHPDLWKAASSYLLFISNKSQNISLKPNYALNLCLDEDLDFHISQLGTQLIFTWHDTTYPSLAHVLYSGVTSVLISWFCGKAKLLRGRRLLAAYLVIACDSDVSSMSYALLWPCNFLSSPNRGYTLSANLSLFLNNVLTTFMIQFCITRTWSRRGEREV